MQTIEQSKNQRLRSVKDYYYWAASFFPINSASFTASYTLQDVGRNARIEKKKKKEGKVGEGHWRGAADAPSSLIKTDRPLFFLRPSNNEIYFIIPPNSFAAWTGARNFSRDSIPRKNLIKVMIAIMAATIRSNLAGARARSRNPP